MTMLAKVSSKILSSPLLVSALCLALLVAFFMLVSFGLHFKPEDNTNLFI
jgi:hypothetical protein